MRKIVLGGLVGACLGAGFLFGHFTRHSSTGDMRRILFYEDPMHPAYRSDKPGKAPDCGMDLVPVYADSVVQSLERHEQAALGDLEIEPSTLQLYGIKVAKARMDSGPEQLMLYARVEADETRIYKVNFGTDGYVKETQDDAVGTRVKKDQRLAVVYSPDFLSVAGGFLAANEHTPGAPTSPKDNFNASTTATQGTASVLARADRLRNLGMSDSQIEEISRTRKLPEDVYIVSPTDGFILSRSVTPGMRFERHEDLYTIGDLSHVWIVAEAFGHDAEAIRPGAKATLTIPGSKDRVAASVTAILPEVDPSSHAVRIRLQADNPRFILRPGMFATVQLPISFPPGLSIPADAILDSGVSKRVFVQSASGGFSPRIVETGWLNGDRVQVVKGLEPGETVASSGTFLIDSEARLRLPAPTVAVAAANPASRRRMN
jgi:membrane fusion protein, copper/silver efflux system